MLIKISIPSYRKIETDNDKSYTVFIIEVYAHGKRHVVERRYSEFESLHKRIKKNVRTPEFPPKKMMKWNHKVLEQRRIALEAYLQVILDRGSVPRSLLRFVEIEGESETTDTIDKVEDIGPTHQPVLAFSEDVFVLDQKDGMQDIISTGVLGGFYGSTDDIR